MSYLFSGLFIGPTSQAPRIDEARNDLLYEMEIAFNQIPDPSYGWTPPWLVDRVFRNLLIDLAATRTARKSASTSSIRPTALSGRLGLVEFRNFRDAAACAHEPCAAASCCAR